MAHFDAIVLGAGPGGEHAAARLDQLGLSTALVERELVGGECAYWACIPSKTLLRAPEARHEAERLAGLSTPDYRWREIAAYRDFMIRDLDDAKEIESYEDTGVTVFKGEGRLDGRGRVQVGEQRLESDRIIIATGSEPVIPAIAGLEQAGFWTNRQATTFQEIPPSAVILGGGPVGVELAQLLRRLGSEVSLVEGAERLLAREDPRVGALLLEALRADGVDVHVGAEAVSVGRRGQERTVQLAGGTELQARELVVAVGRTPRTSGLDLKSAGIAPSGKGIEIDERCRVTDGVWAIGDVTGVMPFTHVAMYQARIACLDIAGQPARADYAAVPRVVFCDPEVAAVGRTEAQARHDGIEVAGSHVELPKVIARPWTYETDPRGELSITLDRRRRVLVGAWAVGPLAGEWIHYAALAIKAQVPLEVLRDTVAQFPTYSEAYFRALDQLEL